MTRKVTFQFTPSEPSSDSIDPHKRVDENRVSDFGEDSFQIECDTGTITVSFGNRIRYTPKETEQPLREILEEAECKIRESLDTTLRHFQLQIVFDADIPSAEVQYHTELSEISSEKSLGEYTSNTLSTGNTAISFIEREKSLIV